MSKKFVGSGVEVAPPSTSKKFEVAADAVIVGPCTGKFIVGGKKIVEVAIAVDFWMDKKLDGPTGKKLDSFGVDWGPSCTGKEFKVTADAIDVGPLCTDRKFDVASIADDCGLGKKLDGFAVDWGPLCTGKESDWITIKVVDA